MRRGSSRAKRSKTRSCWSGGYPAVVGDAELKAIAGDGRAELDRRAWRGVPDRVRGQLHDRLGDALRIQDSFASGGAGQVNLFVGAVERADLDGHRPGQGGDVDGLGRRKSGRSLLASSMSSSTNRVILVSSSATIDRVLGILIRCHRERVEVALDDGDRGAQFMPGIGEKPALRGERGLQPVEHPVEGVREFADLTSATGVAGAPVIASTGLAAPDGIPDRDAAGDVGIGDPAASSVVSRSGRSTRPPISQATAAPSSSATPPTSACS